MCPRISFDLNTLTIILQLFLFSASITEAGVIATLKDVQDVLGHHDDSAKITGDGCTGALAFNVFRTAKVLPVRAYVLSDLDKATRKDVCSVKPPNVGGLSSVEIMVQHLAKNQEFTVDSTFQVKSGEIGYIEAYLSRDSIPEDKSPHTINLSNGGGLVANFVSTPIKNPEDWVIISDVEDTIKDTGVNNEFKVVREAILKTPYRANKGFAESYAELYEQLSHPPIYFISASPIPIYNRLHPWLADLYKMPFELFFQNTPMHNIKQAVALLTANPFDYNNSRIQPLIADSFLPKANWLLIGDSTQQDPEVYRSLVAKIAGRKKQYCIWIHIVSGYDESKEKTLNSKRRFEETWKKYNVPEDRQCLFTDGGVLGTIDVKGGKCRPEGAKDAELQP